MGRRSRWWIITREGGLIMAVYSTAKDSKGYRFHLEIIQVSQDISANTSLVSWKTYLTNETSTVSNRGMTTNAVVNGVTVLNNTNYRLTMMSTYSTLVIGSGTQTITHNADGTKSISVSALMVGNTVFAYGPQGTHSISETFALTTIPRASYPSPYYSGRNVGDSQRHTTNRASTAFTHTLQYRYGSQAWTTIETGITDYVDWIVPLSLASNIPNGTSGTVEVRLITYNGGTYIGELNSYFSFFVPNNATFQPSASIDNINVVDGLGAYFVQGKSKVNVKSSGTGKYGASISQYKVTIDGSNYYGSNITSGVINKSGTVTITLLVTDSRGFTKSTSTTVTYQEYYSPKISTFTAKRTTQTSTNLTVSVGFDIATIANQNAKYYAISYRETGGSWVSLYSSSSYYSRTTTHSASGVLDANKSYEVKLELRDSYNTSSNPITSTKTIGTVFKLMHFNKSGKGMAIGKFSENPNGLEIALPTDFSQAPTVNGAAIGGIGFLDVYPVGAIYMSVLSTNPGTLFGGTWSPLGGRMLIGVDGTYTNGATGGSSTHTHTSAPHTHAIASHSHTVNSHTHTSAPHSHGSGGLHAGINISMAGTTFIWRSGSSFVATSYVKGGSGSYGTGTNDSNSNGATVYGTTDSTTPGATGASAPGTSGVSLTTDSTTPGTTGSASSLPPYLAVYMWKRTA